MRSPGGRGVFGRAECLFVRVVGRFTEDRLKVAKPVDVFFSLAGFVRSFLRFSAFCPIQPVTTRCSARSARRTLLRGVRPTTVPRVPCCSQWTLIRNLEESIRLSRALTVPALTTMTLRWLPLLLLLLLDVAPPRRRWAHGGGRLVAGCRRLGEDAACHVVVSGINGERGRLGGKRRKRRTWDMGIGEQARRTELTTSSNKRRRRAAKACLAITSSPSLPTSLAQKNTPPTQPTLDLNGWVPKRTRRTQ